MDQHPRFEVGRTFADAWHAVIGDLATAIIGGVIFFSCALASFFTIVGFFLFFPVLLYGGAKMLLNLQDGIAGYSDLGEGFPRYWSVLGDTLVLMLMQSLLFVPFVLTATVGATFEVEAIARTAPLAGLLVSVVLASRFVFAPFYLADHHLGPVDAMKASWSATSHQMPASVLLVIASAIVALAGSACGITALISIPMSWVMFASAFRQMHPAPKKK